MSKIIEKKNKHGLDLTEGSVSSVLLRFSLPFLISGIINSLYGAVDMFVISKYTTAEVISGVSTGTQVMMLIFAFTVGIGTGGTVLIGRKIGEKDDEGCARSTGTFLLIGIGLAILLTLGLAIGLDPLLKVLRTPAEAMESARRYVSLALIGVPFNVGYAMLGSISRGLGNSTAPSVVGGIASVIHILLDFLFVGVFRMAESGVGIATGLSQILTFVMMGLWLLKKRFPFEFSKKHLVFDKSAAASVFKVGVPLWLQELLVNVSFMMITAMVNDLGVVASAAVGIINKVFNLGAMVPLAIGNAIAAITAQNIGARKRDRAKKALMLGIGYALVIEVVFLILCQVAPETITGFFAEGKHDVISAAAAHLRSFSLDLIFVAFIFCINSYLSGSGKSTIVMIHSLATTFIIRVPVSLLFSRMDVELNHKLFLLGLAAPLATLGSILICIPYIIQLERKVKLDGERLK